MKINLYLFKNKKEKVYNSQVEKMTFNDNIMAEGPERGSNPNLLGVPEHPPPRGRRPSWARPMTPQSRRIFREEDEEWSTPVAKILQLYYDHESWQQAQEILEGPTAVCRKFGDEV